MKFLFNSLIRVVFVLLWGAFAYCEPTAPKLYHTGAGEDFVTQPEFGALLMGGATEPDDGVEWLLNKAKGGDVVVLRASGSDGYNDYFYREIGGVNSVRSFVFSSRNEAFSNTVLDALEQAELIFLAGGDQAKYLRYWKGTPVQVLINQHLAKGKPIGGTSAGLAVLGDTVYAAYKDSIKSGEALRDPNSEDLTLERGFLKVPYLQNVVTDSHFSERGRLGRMLAFQVMGTHLRNRDPLVAIGVDESTALAIDTNGVAQVFSRVAHSRVYLSVLQANPSMPDEDAPLNLEEAYVIALDRDSELQLPDLKIDEAYAISRIEVRDGEIKELEPR